MILLKDLIEEKIKPEFKETITSLLGDMPRISEILNKISTEATIPQGKDAMDLLFNFFSDRGNWTPQDSIKGYNNHPLTITFGLDDKGRPNVKTVYPIAILITDATNGSYQKSAELDAYSMIYNFEVIAEDYDYEEIQLLLSTHSNRFNQFNDSVTFSSRNFTNMIVYDIPSFGTIQNAFGRQMFSSFMQFSMLFVKNGVLGNTVKLSMKIEEDTLITAGSFITGNRYKIQTIGTTNFITIGAASNTVGLEFIATGPGTGTGTAFTAYFLPIPFITFGMTKSKIGDANTFQGEKIAKMLHNQQVLTFNIGLIYTKSTVTTQILNEIFEEDYLSKIYTLRYEDGEIEKDFKIMLSDSSITANNGEFVILASSWVIAKELI